MTTFLQKPAALLFIAFTLPAWAVNEQDSYAQSVAVPNSDTVQYEQAKVLDAQPITAIIRTPQEQQVCREQSVQRRVPEHRSPGPAIFGAILGGLIGNKLGKGHGRGHRYGHGHGNRAAATVAGAAIGGAIGTHVQNDKYPPKYYSTIEQDCYQETRWLEEERVVAWDVTWLYEGKTYHSRMDNPPGETIPVRINVEPAL